MPKIKINNREHEVDPAMLEAVAGRLQNRLISVRNISRLSAVDYQTVRAELVRLYPALPAKEWFWDFVIQFCKLRGIQCPLKDTGGKNVIIT